MTFGFQLLSLLMIFLLVIVYYTKKDSFSKGNKIFRGILLVTYIMQLCSVCIYAVMESAGNQAKFFGKIDFAMVMLWFALFALYYVVIWLKSKYKKESNKLQIVFRDLMVIFIVIQVIGVIGTLVAPVGFTYDMVDYYGHFVIYFICFYLGIEFFILLMVMKKIERKKYFHLFVIFIIQLVMFFLQARSPEIPIFNIGFIFSVFYCYFMLENMDKLELKNLKLERDYAKRQSIEKHEFLKVLSHEIRTPLNAIDGFSQVILDSDNLEEIKDDVKDIQVASRDLIDVINGMIDLSIIESGNLEIVSENYNVYDMFDSIFGIAESKMRGKKVELKMQVSEDIPEVLLGDSERISQVVLNLLTNAIKYTDKGTITLKVESVRSSAMCRLKISVMDTGRGIKNEDLATIFEGKAGKEGITLGLAVSKYLIEMMGGTIEVESTYGEGSSFLVTLDQKIISDVVEDKGSRKRVLKPFKAIGKRILLVDDNKLNLKVATKLLQPYELEIVEVSSGKECLDILDRDINFDLILMDDLMPEMSGTECLDILKKIERVDGYYIPVVVLTANAVSGMKEKYLNAGFEDYLSKPIDKYELDKILKKYLKGKK